MNEAFWEANCDEMLANGQIQTELSSMASTRLGTSRSQDDAMVRYFFQRPQNDPYFQSYNKQTHWALGDDSVLEVRGNETTEMESGFQALALEAGHPLQATPTKTTFRAPSQISANSKKIWGLEENSLKNADKGIFIGDHWRDTPWSTGHNGASEHAMSQPVMVQRRSGSYPGSDATNLLSPRSTDTGGLGMKMVEYVLGSSPVPKDLDSHMARLHVTLMDSSDVSQERESIKGKFNNDHKKKKSDDNGSHGNGILQNGLDEEKEFSHQSLRTDDDVTKASINDMSKHPNTDVSRGNDSFESVGIDPLQFDYPHLHSDSPNILDYTSELYHQQRGQAHHCMPVQQINQQQYPLSTNQHGPNHGVPQTTPTAGPYSSVPYVPNQDPYNSMATVMSGPTVMPQYYGMSPWGMFPPGGMMTGNRGQPQDPSLQLMPGGRTPGTNGENLSQPGVTIPSNIQESGGQYQLLGPPYFNQIIGSTRPTMRIMPPMIVNPVSTPANTPGNFNNSGIHLLGSQSQNSSLFSNNPLYSSPTNLNYSPASSNIGFQGSQLNLGLGQTQANTGFGNNNFGTSNIGGMDTGIGVNTNSSLCDTLDCWENSAVRGGAGNGFGTGLENHFSQHGQKSNFSTVALPQRLGPIGMLPPSQTPPPSSLNGSCNNLNMGCMVSAAPGAEAKYLIRNSPLASVFGSSSHSLFLNSNSLQRKSSVNDSLSTIEKRNASQRLPRIEPMCNGCSLDKSGGRSRLLEDFRNNRYPNLQLHDLGNHIVEFSQDQHGSRFIQQKLENATAAEKQLVFNEILGAAYNLMTDVFGNYVIQKFFEFGTTEQKQALAQKVKGNVLPLALQMYGCRVIQKALESVSAEQQTEIVKELDGHVLKCVKDQNGNHVVQKCIECVDPLALQFIINAFRGQVFPLSTHPYGCRVIQRILEHCVAEQTCPVLEEIHQHTEELVQDQYGNYVVQHVLERGRQEDKSKIVAVVRGKVLQLSQHKFASNVVEKCVTYASRNERNLLIEEVSTLNDGPHSALYTMMKDQYANYVVQKMIEVAESAQRKLLLSKIRPHIPGLRKYTYGKHILAKLEKNIMKNSDHGPTPNGVI